MKKRVVETNEGIQDALTVAVFDTFARGMRDRGWNNVDAFLAAGIRGGTVLEVGPGPGYVGLEWLSKAVPEARLTDLEISEAMIRMAEKNAKDYGFSERTAYTRGNAMDMPFAADTFDAAFSNGSLHEWEEPARVIDELYRVLKPGGVLCISDMRRDINPLLKWSVYATVKPREIRPGYLSSLGAAYTVEEMTAILCGTAFSGASVKRDLFGLKVVGRKA